MKNAEGILRTTKALQAGIEEIPNLYIIGKPEASVFAIGSDKLNLSLISDRMTSRGWHMDLQQYPDSLHFMVTPAHEGIVVEFLKDLRDSVQEAVDWTGGEADQAALYGLEGSLPEGVNVKDYLIYMLNELMSSQDQYEGEEVEN